MRRAAALLAASLLILALGGCGSEAYVVRTEQPLPGGMTLEDYNARYHPETVTPTPPADYMPAQQPARAVPDPDAAPEPAPEPEELPVAVPEETPAPEIGGAEDPEEAYVYSAEMVEAGNGKYHRADGDCWARDRITDENRRTGTRSECEALGLTPCGVCEP